MPTPDRGGAELGEAMPFKYPMLVTKDLPHAIEFYRRVFGIHVILDFGANVTLTGGLCLQTLESWAELTRKSPQDIAFGGCDAELYFEEEDYEDFIDRLEKVPGIRYIHPTFEQRWGQRVVRFYDPDDHIIEVGESIRGVCRRFFAAGMTPREIAHRMDVPETFVNNCLRERKSKK